MLLAMCAAVRTRRSMVSITVGKTLQPRSIFIYIAHTTPISYYDLMQFFRYMYFNVERAVELMGGDALSEAQKQAGITLVDHSKDTNKISFCLGITDTTRDPSKTTTTTTTTTTKPTTETEITKALLKTDPVTNLLTGGGTCRYCVEKCPDKYSVFIWRCMPQQLSNSAVGLFSTSGAKSLVEEVIADIELAWKEIIYMCLIALGKNLLLGSFRNGSRLSSFPP